jgi:hypothetical protein
MRIVSRLLAIVVLVLLPLLALPSASQEPGKVFKAGAVAQDITPKKFPVSVNGGMQDRLAKGAHDPLHARCLVLDDGTTRVAFVVCDSCMIPREIFDPARAKASKATGIPAANILLSATHTHTAVTVTGVFQSDPVEEYIPYLIDQIAAGIIQADKQREPAKIGWTVGKDATQLFNRRWKMKAENIGTNPFGGTRDQVRMNPGYQAPGLIEPAGPTDPEIPMLSVQAKDGRPIAVLANYALHYVGGLEPLSADYFAAFAERLTDLIGARKAEPAFVGFMSNGASGDINNVNFAGPTPGKREPGEQIRIVSESVAQAAFAAYKTIRYHDHVTLAVAEKEIELGVRLPTEKDLEYARDILEKAREKKVLTTQPEVYARETTLLAKYPKTVKARLMAVRVGEMGIVSSPCETFTEIGLEIKAKSPLKPTMLIELANGYNGYLPTPAQHKLGGYETWRARSSYVAEDSSPKIVTTLLELLDQVKK